MLKYDFGIQMFCLRDITPQSMKNALKAVADMGYKQVEFGGLYEYTPRQIKIWLDEAGLSCCGAHIGFDEIEPDKIKSTIEKYKAVGCNNLIVPWCDASNAQLADRVISIFNSADKTLGENGILLGYHNHSFEFFPTTVDGIVMEDEIINRTSLHLQIDTFWLLNAGIDVLSYLEEHKDRIRVIHLKDGIPAPEENQNYEDNTKGVCGLSLGLGHVPVREICDWAIANNVQIVVESEGMQPSGIEEVARCMDYLKTL